MQRDPSAHAWAVDPGASPTLRSGEGLEQVEAFCGANYRNPSLIMTNKLLEAGISAL